MTYPGGKAGAGVYQSIINLMPPHRTYIEAFLGAGAVLRAKRPAELNIGIDLDAAAIASFNDAAGEPSGVTLVCDDAARFLQSFAWRGGELVYCDPPYLMSTRRQHRRIYRCELGTEAEHISLLELLLTLPCNVMISGYRSSLYDRLIGHWRRVEFAGVNRAGQRTTECVWLNFAEPFALHDYRYLGSSFRERERIRKKKRRWAEKIARMPALERACILAAIDEARRRGPSPEVSRLEHLHQ